MSNQIKVSVTLTDQQHAALMEVAKALSVNRETALRWCLMQSYQAIVAEVVDRRRPSLWQRLVGWVRR